MRIALAAISALLIHLSSYGQGNWQWAIDASSVNNEEALDVAIDTANGFAYIVGRWDGALNAVYGAGAGSADFTTTYGGEDGFLAKYDLSGNLIWAFKVGGVNDDALTGVAVGPSGNIYVTGYFEGIAEYEGIIPNAINSATTPFAGQDIVEASYDPNGELRWMWEDGDTGTDYGTDVAVNSTGVYFTGSYTGNAEIGGFFTASLAGGLEVYVVKRGFSGSPDWLIDGASDADDVGNGLAADNTGVYLIGDFSGSSITMLDWLVNPSSTIPNASGASGSSDIFILSIDESFGTFNWLSTIGSSQNDFGNGVDVDGSAVYFTGATNVNPTFPGLGALSGQDGQDFFVSGHDITTGDAMWANSETGTGDDMGHDVNVDHYGYLYTVGEFSGTTNFSSMVMTSLGGSDVFIARYATSGTIDWTRSAGDDDLDVAYSVGTYQSDRAYVAGMFEDDIDFIPLPIITSDITPNIYLAEIRTTPCDAGFNYAATTFCSGNANPLPIITGDSGGQFTGPAGIVFADGSPSSTGEIDLSTSTAGGPYTITYTAPGICTETFDITVVATPTTADAGSDQLVCAGTSTTMAANIPVSGSGIWTLVSGSGTITAPLNPTTTITGLGPGVNTFEWTISNPPCAPSSSLVNIELDNTPPLIACPIDFNENANSSCQFVIPDYTGLPTFLSDNCGPSGITVTQSPVVGNIVGLGPTVITLTATDAQGNSASCNFTITVLDPIPPTITGCPANITVNNTTGACAANVSWVAPAATDNCSGVGISQTSGLFSGSSFPVGISTIEYTATDGAGNTSICSFTVTVIDTESPFAGCFGDVNVNTAFGSCGAVATWTTPAVSDNCPGAVITQTGGPVSGSTFPTGSTLITYTATDAAGNTDACSFNVIVVDAQNPTFSGCPSNITVSNDVGNCSAVVAWVAPTPLDNCPGVAMTQTGGPASGSSFPVGSTPITYTVTDAAGNTATCSFNIIVDDNESPSIVCPTDQVASVNAACEFDLLDYTSLAVVSDNCTPAASVTLSQSPAPGTTVTSNTMITITADDGNGNSSVCNFNLILQDNLAPVLTCPPDQTEYVDGSCGFLIPDYTGVLGVSDNCDAFPGIIQTPVAGTAIFGYGTTQTISFDVTDSSGNTSTCTFDITLADTIAPVLACPGDQNEIPGAGCSFTLPDYSSLASATDNCTASPSITISQTPLPATSITGNTTITLTADDGNGNTESCTFDVILADATPPIITCANDTAVNNDPGICGAFVAPSLPIATDDCGVTSLINDFNGTLDASDNYPLGTTTVTWTASDALLNSSSCSMTITVVDVEAPVITCATDTIIGNDNGSCNAIYTYSVTATDNCSQTVAQIAGLPSGSVFPGGTTVNTFVATDLAGNTDTCSFNITVIDTENPVITCPGDIVQCTNPVAVGTPIFSDNCLVDTYINDYNGTSDATDTYPVGTTVIIWTVTDTAGNSASCTMNVTIDAMPAPVNAGPDQYLDYEFETYLDATPPVAGSGVWSNSPGNGNIWNINNPGSYIDQLELGANEVTWTVTNGTCPPISDVVIIYINDIWIPEAVTPNGDGQNDFFTITGIENTFNTVQIYNRWGQPVFERTNYENDWDGVNANGEKLPNDTYFYIITVNNELEYNGYVVVKR